MAALLRSLAEKDSEKADLGPAKRVYALHKLASLWPRWQRGKGVLDLVAALCPGFHGIPEFTPTQWDTFLGAIEGMKSQPATAWRGQRCRCFANNQGASNICHS